MLANMSGELAVSPAGKPFLRDGYLRPGEVTSGKLQISNQTPKALLVTLRATAETPDLVPLLELEVRAGRQLVYRGDLAGLRRFTPDAIPLDVDARQVIHARAWLPKGSGKRSGNRAAEMTVELRATTVAVPS